MQTQLPDHPIPASIGDLTSIEFRAQQTRKQGGTPCDVCGDRATMVIRCQAARFASFRCDADAAGVAEGFRAMNVTVLIDPMRYLEKAGA